MVLDKKGQFFLIILVFMIIIIVGLAYYSVESRGLPAETRAPPEKGTALLTQVKNELMNALERRPYTGKNVSEYYDTFYTKANRTNFELHINCNETDTTTGPNNYPKYDLECELNISWEDANLTTTFTHSYTVLYEIKTYSDANYITEANYFYINDTVYYRITGRDNDIINFTAKYRGNLENTQNHTLSNHHDDGNFIVDKGGVWQLRITNYNTSEIYNKVIYVQQIQIDIETQGEGSAWQPRDSFVPGEQMRIKVNAYDLKGRPVDVPIMISIRREDGTPPVGDYDEEITIGTDGEYIGEPYTIHQEESADNWTITVTELTYHSSNSTTVEILGSQYGTFIPIPASRMDYNAQHDGTFSATCGYNEWFLSDNQSYNNGSIDIPFYCHNQTGSDTVSLNTTTRTIDIPQLHARVIHIIGAEHNITDEAG